MKITEEDIAASLQKKKVGLPRQRRKILSYLVQNQNHPTADQIYLDLKKETPALSKTTVYNTLHILVNAGLLRIINIEDNETRYDIVTANHGHFKCEGCGEIFNFEIDDALLSAPKLPGFKVSDRQLYFKGFCPKCLENKNDEN